MFYLFWLYHFFLACEALQDIDSSVEVDTDETLDKVVLEILGKANVSFPCRSIYPNLAIYLKFCDRFFSFEIEIVDDLKKYRTIIASNHRSSATIDGDKAELPIAINQDEAWHYLNLNLKDLVKRSFGSEFLTCTNIKFNGTCSVYKVFFQDRIYADCELPAHLRVVP